MNFNPNIFDFERGMVYTRKRNEQIPNSDNIHNIQRPMPIVYNNNDNNWTNQIYEANKKDSRQDMNSRFSNYMPLATTQHFPIIGQNNNNFFFDNKPINTRLEGQEIYKQCEQTYQTNLKK
jgi:hypothetical protein